MRAASELFAAPVVGVMLPVPEAYGLLSEPRRHPRLHRRLHQVVCSGRRRRCCAGTSDGRRCPRWPWVILPGAKGAVLQSPPERGCERHIGPSQWSRRPDQGCPVLGCVDRVVSVCAASCPDGAAVIVTRSASARRRRPRPGRGSRPGRDRRRRPRRGPDGRGRVGMDASFASRIAATATQASGHDGRESTRAGRERPSDRTYGIGVLCDDDYSFIAGSVPEDPKDILLQRTIDFDLGWPVSALFQQGVRFDVRRVGSSRGQTRDDPK